VPEQTQNAHTEHSTLSGGKKQIMTEIPNPRSLLLQHYKDGSRLTARAYLQVRFGTNPYKWTSWIFDHLTFPSQCRLLELGAGTAWLWTRNMARIPQGWHITLTDFSQGILDETQQRLLNSPRPFDFAVVDAQAIPYGDNEFDGVIANHMLYHVPDRPRALAEIRRVLKPGGHFYASTLGANHLCEMDNLFPGRALDVRNRFTFNLENGEEQITPYFPNVTRYNYENNLIVTEPEPVVAYLLSLSRNQQSSESDLREHIFKRTQDHITEHGALHLSGDMGLFEAW
jgi:ubiquinone/menaquinone biosynthesis C-methylase UbiE